MFYFAAIGSALSLLPLPWLWQTPSYSQMLWLLLLGTFATIGQLLLTRGMACAPAARIGPFTFFSVVFGALLGWIFWEETLKWPTVFGTLFIFVAAMLVGRGLASARSPVLQTS